LVVVRFTKRGLITLWKSNVFARSQKYCKCLEVVVSATGLPARMLCSVILGVVLTVINMDHLCYIGRLLKLLNHGYFEEDCTSKNIFVLLDSLALILDCLYFIVVQKQSGYTRMAAKQWENFRQINKKEITTIFSITKLRKI